jgi:hypothetical protein
MLIEAAEPAPLQGGTVVSVGETGAATIRPAPPITNATLTAGVGAGPQ